MKMILLIVNGRPIHTVIAYDEDTNNVHVITTYEPALDIFESDYRTRRK